MNEMKEFTFTLSEQEANYLLNVLAEQPFKNCAALIGKMEQQVTEQIEPAKEEKLTVKK